MRLIERESMNTIGSRSMGFIENNFWTFGASQGMIFFEEEINGLCYYRTVHRRER